MPKPIGYYASAPSGTFDAAILAKIEKCFGSYLETLTNAQKSAWAIALITEAVSPEGLDVDYPLDEIPKIKILKGLNKFNKLDLATAVLAYLRESVLTESREEKS